jgi:hypothetical protein
MAVIPTNRHPAEKSLKRHELRTRGDCLLKPLVINSEGLRKRELSKAFRRSTTGVVDAIASPVYHSFAAEEQENEKNDERPKAKRTGIQAAESPMV